MELADTSDRTYKLWHVRLLYVWLCIYKQAHQIIHPS
jgi:hypothetical protein